MNEIFHKIEPYLSYELWGNTLKQYLMALILFIVLLIVFRIFRLFILKYLKKLAGKTKNAFDDELIKTVGRVHYLFYLFLALYFPLKVLSTTPGIEKIIDGVFIVVLIVQVIFAVQSMAEYGIRLLISRNDGGDYRETTLHGLRLLMKIVLWTVGLLLVLSNLGVNITSLVASLGIGGIAVALAVQNILSDVFSSFSIYFDKPFQVGDTIQIGQDVGEVKKIGLKTTRLQTLQGEELVISNNELTNARVQNYKKMETRRVDLNLGFVYDTDLSKLKKVNEIVEKTIKNTEEVEFSRCHFVEFGDFSLKFACVYYVLSNEYDVYANRQQEINFALKDAFDKEGIEMAFPTQTIFVEK